MNVLYFLLPIALLMGVMFLVLFIWATRRGQFDDLETPAHRILLEEENINTKPLTGVKRDE